MFTGIITHQGRVRRLERSGGGARIEIESDLPETALGIGDSVAHDGVCLTVTQTGEVDGSGAGRRWHGADVSAETLARTTLGEWAAGRSVNLEAAARFGDPIGGHHVLGHVDGVGQVMRAAPGDDSIVLDILAPAALAPFIAEKGSVAVDGVSLTVNGVRDEPDGGAVFALSIIPHTAAVTTIGAWAPGRRVNLEIDPLARYVARLMEAGSAR